MWTEEKVKEYTRECIDKHDQTASAIALKSNYVEDTGWRFDKMRAVIDREIQLYKQEVKDETIRRN